MKVKFLKGAWWVMINHQGRRKAKRIGDRETALSIAKRIRERIAAGELQLGPLADETLETFAGEWLKTGAGNLKASTLAFYGDNLRRHVLPLLGRRPVGSLTRADCRELITVSRAKGLKLNTVRGIARTLSVVLSQAVEDEKLPANPALRMGRYLRRGDEPEAEIHPLTTDEAAHLVATAAEYFPRWQAWTLCALRTGLRSGELLGLQWGDIDWHGRFMLVQRNIVRGVLTTPKSHQRRRVDLSVQLVEVLLDWRRQQRAASLKKGAEVPVWLFPSRTGTALEERNVRHVYTRLLAKAELHHRRIHDLRQHLREPAAPSRGADHVRVSTARPCRRLHNAEGVCALPARPVPQGRRPAGRATKRNPRATSARRDGDRPVRT
ncbi:MAG: tyrosine-type recombinase/integrase [Vicinamibacterales bacterium]